MRVQIPASVLLLLLLNGSANATSIVVQVDLGKILFAADTRGTKLDVGSKVTEDTECKIALLGNAAFAVTGIEDYVQNRLDDPVASWDSRSDAREAYMEHRGDLVAMSDDWAARAKQHYLSFYFANPARVKQLAQANEKNILLAGFFSGFQDGKAILLLRWLYLDEHELSPIVDNQRVLSARELPYTSNGVTNELIEGHSEKTNAANAAWAKESRSIPLSSEAFRRVEFLIQFTANYDQTVGTRVNVLEIVRHKAPRWLQNFTCSSAE